MKTKIILLDIDGCIMPPNRAEVDLHKLITLKSYIDIIKKSDSLAVSIYTGRSQEYVEFLSQVLGLVDYTIPFVIENGTAFYFPHTKSTIPTFKDGETLQKARVLLQRSFPNNPFEPKINIFTLNPKDKEGIPELRESVYAVLDSHNLIEQLDITNSASSVDILPKGINKLYGVKHLLREYVDTDVESIAIGDSQTDKDVLLYCDRAYVPENASKELKEALSSHKDFTILNAPHIDAVLKMFEIEIS